jgi:hypothetical protein
MRLTFSYTSHRNIVKRCWFVDASGFVEPKVVTASCPTQNNLTDYGVYCLHYVLNFYQDTDTMIATVLVSVYV